MPGQLESAGPSYISAHSADIILSEVRPIKLKGDALRSINVLLDEFLYNILNVAGSIQTDKLRASLLSLLPTTLGKEALLEAEVELRAYWERTGPADVTSTPREDDSVPFHLQWVFELLRAKCEAYSTLNESDDDPAIEERINARMNTSGATPPKAALITPAALYLTAILEALCEHILSDVGRVASRDSSRQHATIQDLFTGLCEDHSIYSLFKGMKVYEQIEQLSRQGKPRSSKSFTRNEKAPPRTSSPHLDSASSSRSRLSSDAPASATSTFVGGTSLTNTGSRPSFEKSKALKMFKSTNRSSIDRDADSQNGHKKSGSLSESLKQPATPTSEVGSASFEDELLQQQFDDLMRSSATMKVSLTPDRLKTMEAYKQEKDQRGNRNRRTGTHASPKVDADVPSSVPPRAPGLRPSLIRVDSIKEDEEDPPLSAPPVSATRPRQHSVDHSTPTSPLASGRARSISTSATQRPAIRALPQPPMPAPLLQSRRKDDANNGFPPRTRKIQKKRESLDLDDVMGGSDDEDVAPKPKLPAKTPARRPGQGGGVSSSTRELMDFLASGPPDMGGPPAHLSFPTPPNGGDSTKSKGSGRLQRMISKLSLSNLEKSRGLAEDTPKARTSPTNRPPLSQKSSLSNIQYLANRPIPPRPPKPYSPPPSPTHEAPSEQESFSASRKRSASLQSPKKATDHHSAEPPLPSVPTSPGVPGINTKTSTTNGHAKPKSDAVSNSPIVPPRKSSIPAPSAPPTPPDSVSRRTSIRKPPPTYIPDVIKSPTNNSTEELRNLFFRATSADECRLILDMFLLKNGATIDVPKQLPPSPAADSTSTQGSEEDESALEANLVQFLLCGSLSFPAPETTQAAAGSESSSDSFSSAQSTPVVEQQEQEVESPSELNGHTVYPPGLEKEQVSKEVKVES